MPNLKKYTLVRAFLNPIRILWLIKVKIVHHKIPLKTLPSFEHRNLLKIYPFPKKIIDIGFNKGQFTTLILLFKKKSIVYAFDPNKGDTFSIANQLKKLYPRRFQFFNFAIGNKNQNKYLNLALSSDNNTFLKPTLENRKLFSKASLSGVRKKVKTKTLSELNIKFEGPNNLLKIDVQGFEINVLKGVSNEIFENLTWIYLEISEIELYKGQASFFKIDSFLKNKGYLLERKYNILKSANKGKIIYCDALYKKIGSTSRIKP